MRRWTGIDAGASAFVLGLALSMVPTGVAAAQEAPAQHGDPTGEEQAHAEHVNVVAVFLGNTSERSDDTGATHHGFTFGVEYLRRVAPRISLAAALERAGGDVRGTLLLGQIYYRLLGEFALIGGAGVEFRDGHSDEIAPQGHMAGGGEHAQREDEGTVFLARIGATYEFEIDRWIVGPMVAIDLVGRDEALVLGVNVGYAF